MAVKNLAQILVIFLIVLVLVVGVLYLVLFNGDIILTSRALWGCLRSMPIM